MPRREIVFGGLHNTYAESRTPDGRAFAMSNSSVDDKTFKCGKRYANVGTRPSADVSDVCYGLGYGKFTCNETQTLTLSGSPTGGTLTLTWGTTTAALAYNASASDVQTALVALVGIEDGEVSCSGGPWPVEAINVTFKGRYAGASQTLITYNLASLTGGTPAMSVARLVTGGDHEEFLVVIQPSGTGTCTLYSVTSSDNFDSTSWNSVATGLTASDWFFQQYTDKIYACNSTDGILYKRLGGAWSGVLGITGVQNPTSAPTSAPYSSYGSGTALTPFSFKTGGTATVGSFVGWGSDPTIAVASDGSNIKFTLNAALAGDKVSCIVTLHGAEDFSVQDFWQAQFYSTESEITILPGSMTFSLTNSDSTPATIVPPFVGSGSTATNGTISGTYQFFHFGSITRNLRDNTVKLNISFIVPNGTSGKAVTLTLFPMDTWPNDQMVGLNIDGGAILRGVEYAYSYLKTSTGAETKLSPSKFGPVVPDYGNFGRHIQVSMPGASQLTTSDYIKIYRKDRFGLWRFIGRTANITTIGTTEFVDTNMLDELDAYPIFGVITLPGGFLPEYITRWKQCMAVASDRKIWLSYVGNPLVFAPDPDLFAAQSTLDTTDPNIPRTAFMSDTRSEDVIGIVGQDSLYLAGPDTAYAMTNGDKPMELSPPRPLPEERGCMGYRAAFKLSGGALFAFADGLWYNSVSAGFTGIVQSGTVIQEEESKEIRGSWKDIFGGSPAGAIVYVYQSEIYCVAGTRYIKFTRNKQIEEGTLTDSMLAIIGSAANGLIWASSTGKLMKFGDHVTDAGVDVAFSYTTGILEGERQRITGIEVQYTGEPAVTLEAWDGLGGYVEQRFDMIPIGPDGSPTISYDAAGDAIQGVRFRVTLSGTGSDEIQSLFVEFEDASQGGKGN